MFAFHNKCGNEERTKYFTFFIFHFGRKNICLELVIFVLDCIDPSQFLQSI